MKFSMSKAVAVIAAFLSSSVAYAQEIPAIGAGLTKLQSGLTVLGVTIVTLAFMYVGVMWWRGRGGEVTINVFIGAFFFGGAALIATWVMTSA